MKPFKKYPVVLLLAVVLLGSLPLLAVLQYNWLAQLSRAEYVQMQSNLENLAHRFSQDIDKEALSAHIVFMGPGMESHESLADGLAERLSRWQFISTYADIIESIYWIEGDPSEDPQLYRYDADSNSIIPAAWTTTIVDWMTQQPRYEDYSWPASTDKPNQLVSPVPFSGTSQEILSGRTSSFAWPMEMLVGGSFNQLLLSFDTGYIFEYMVPALVEDHFAGPIKSDFDILITERGSPEKVMYQSDPELTYGSFSDQDLSINVGIPDQPQMVNMFTQLTEDLPMISPDMMWEAIKKRFRSSGINRPFDNAPSVGQETDLDGILPVKTWQLHIKYKAGPLDEIVARARTRNLWISFAVLLLLGISLILIVVYTRRAQQLANQQLAFVAGVSHELRTPLAVVHAAGENLKDGLITDSNETKDYGKLIVDESQSLLNTIEQVLAYAGISFGNAPPINTRVDINQLITSILENNQPALKDFEIALHLEDKLPHVQGDREALQTVLQNLVQNAIKYSNGKKSLTILSHTSTLNKDAIEIVIRDQGIGIEQTEQDSIFEPFYRTQTTRKTQIRGNGLGLSIAKQIVDAHGGKIRVMSSPGKGSTFYVSLAQTPPQVTRIS